jgi:hypothetical protein
VAVVSFPNAFTGTLAIDSGSWFFGGGFDLIGKLCRTDTCDIDVLTGYRFFELAEYLQFNQHATTLQDGVVAFDNALLPANSQVTFFDRFGVKNEFNGVNVAMRWTMRLGAMTTMLQWGAAVGVNRRLSNNTGFTTRILPDGTSATLPGGIFVLPGSNLGSFVSSAVTAMPEVKFTIGYQCMSWLRVFAGYDFLALPGAVRASQEYNPVINPVRVPTFLGYNPNALPADPTLLIHGRTFWAQGIHMGLEFKY